MHQTVSLALLQDPSTGAKPNISEVGCVRAPNTTTVCSSEHGGHCNRKMFGHWDRRATLREHCREEPGVRIRGPGEHCVRTRDPREHCEDLRSWEALRGPKILVNTTIRMWLYPQVPNLSVRAAKQVGAPVLSHHSNNKEK